MYYNCNIGIGIIMKLRLAVISEFDLMDSRIKSKSYTNHEVIVHGKTHK